nr:MAG TPA: hypothetical protein [Caudoviricetes sp.]
MWFYNFHSYTCINIDRTIIFSIFIICFYNYRYTNI